MAVDVEDNLNHHLNNEHFGVLEAKPFGSIRYYHYRANSTSDRELAVFFHGFNFYSNLYAPFLNKLSERFDVITCDLPGHGETSPMTDMKDYTPDNFILCLQKVIEHCAAADRKLHLIGHSMGGLLAGLAATRPFFKNRLLSVTMCCPAGIHLVEGLDTKLLKTSLGQKIVHANLSRSLRILKKSMEKRTYRYLPEHVATQLRELYNGFLEKHWEKVLLRTFYMIPNFPWSNCHDEFKKLSDLSVPVTIWLSKRDSYVGTKRTAKFFSQDVFSGKVKVIIEENSLHDLPVLIPTKVVEAIKKKDACAADIDIVESV
ncbi:Alpha/beta hydrolase family protein [Giardia duodenalis]|uniref:Alpha/beta hydrolase family protein n=1 Tax=Giardia intestinalis (strain ATCC 50803 / WB clone C6) TaxID=184922 RepID=A8BCI8_GIAIC|nr:Alpha/beta hydrolase family protein [Giardia intestinalis]KAE8301365.1 Alpha/beta hydrolase family protein [Giardia intestinalis]|eukprot:XP_001707914.1 Hypothetical protein GL50803_8960 [Giardia lamblia ATCC 50803]